MRHHRRRRGSSRSASSSASRRSASISATATTPTAASPSACCGRVTRPGSSPVSAGCSAGCSCLAPTTSRSRSGQGRRPRPVKVWPAGTCLGIDPSTNQPTDVPVDCSAPHAMEVTGTVNLAEKFPGGLPSEQDQDAFIKDACTRMTDAFLAPLQLRTTTLTLIYSTISLPSWTAGSHQVACSIGATSATAAGPPCSTAPGRAAHQRTAADPRRTSPGTAEPAADRADADPRPVDAFVFTVDADVFAVRTHVLAVGTQQLAVQPVQPAGQPAPAPAAAAGSGPQAPAPAPAAPAAPAPAPRRTAAARPRASKARRWRLPPHRWSPPRRRLPSARLDEHAAVRRAPRRCAGPDPTRAGGRDRQRRGSRRGP